MSRELQKENRISRYFRETLAELRKVVWPTRDEAINLTMVVLVTIVAMSIFLGVVVDSIFASIVKALIVRQP